MAAVVVGALEVSGPAAARWSDGRGATASENVMDATIAIITTVTLPVSHRLFRSSQNDCMRKSTVSPASASAYMTPAGFVFAKNFMRGRYHIAGRNAIRPRAGDPVGAAACRGRRRGCSKL